MKMMTNIDLEEEMEMPCRCQHCTEWFDLHDGKASKYWYPGTVICTDCRELEIADEAKEDEIEELINELTEYRQIIDDTKFSIRKIESRLKELGVDYVN